MAIDHGRLFGMDVNDNLRGWDDDMVAGTVHPIELFEFFYTLEKNDWKGVWQLDQFPFREDSVARRRTPPSTSSRPCNARWASSTSPPLQEAQDNHDAMAALKLAQKALFTSY